MRIFTHWTRIEEEVILEGQRRQLHCYGGSDQSLNDAARDGRQRMARVKDRIRGALGKKDPAYEADIREEITARLDARNIVTRNRYGAEVLNSTDVVFIDVDEPPFTWRDVFFGVETDLAKRKQRMVEAVRQRAAKPELNGLGIRVYETHKGVRLIVTGRPFDPRTKETQKFLRSFRADFMYTLLCARQGCFRARLTPKPYRMRIKTHRVVFPRLSGRAEQEHQAWLAEYQEKRVKYATCRHLFTLGRPYRNEAIDYHDTATGAFTQLKLA